MSGSVDLSLLPPSGPEEPPVVAELVARPLDSTPRRSRVWTVFVAVLAALVAIVIAQVAAMVVLVAWHLAEGATPGDLQERLLDTVTQPGMFIALGLVGQLTLLTTALAAGWLSPQPLAQRLGLVRPALSAASSGVLIVGVVVPFAVGISLAYALAEVIEPDLSVKALYEKMTPGMALPFLLFISLAPGFSEELLFRGYMQRRLLERWNASAAILVTSLIFALFHITPHAVVFALPVGIWLGLMAWKSRSVWPGIVCHALINGMWNIWQLGVRFDYFPPRPPVGLLVGLGIVGVAAFAASLWLIFRRPQEA